MCDVFVSSPNQVGQFFLLVADVSKCCFLEERDSSDSKSETFLLLFFVDILFAVELEALLDGC